MSMEALERFAQSETLLFKLRFEPNILEQTITKAPENYRSLLLEGQNHAAA